MSSSAFTRSLRGLARASAAVALALAAWPAAAQVKSESLGALDLWSTPGRDTGLSPDLWKGTSPQLASAVLSQVTSRPISPALAAMARRVLATGAAAPDGAGGDLALAALRARALLQLGDAQAASAILARTPRIEASEPLSQARAEALLDEGRDQEACGVGSALQQGRDAPYQLQLRGVCSLIAGQPAAAQVAFDLWRQSGGRDAAFDRLATAAASGGPGARPDLSGGLDFALTRKLGLDPNAAVPDAAPAVLASVARNPASPPIARANSAARGLRLGVVTPEEALAAYGPPPADGSAAFAKKTEAELSVLAQTSADPVIREKAVATLLGRARNGTEFAALARIAAPGIAVVVKAGAPIDDPVAFALASATAGDVATAQTIRGGIEQDKVPGSGPLDLAMLDAVIALAADAPAGPVLDRLVERGTVGDPKLRVRAQSAALLLQAAGQPLSPAARAEFAGFDTPAPKASAERLAALAQAGADKRGGETALLALSIGEQQPAGLSVADRAAIVSALRASGLGPDARAVGIEGLLLLQRP